MAEQLVSAAKFNVDDIKYGAPKVQASGSKNVPILNKSTRSALKLTTPLMVQWGLSDFKKEGADEGDGKFTMGLQFPNAEYPNPEASEMLEKMLAIEEKIKSDALVYSKEWFGKQHKSEDVINALWSPMVKYSKFPKGHPNEGEFDYNKAPTLRVKVETWDGVWKTEIFDQDRNALFPSDDYPGMTPLDFLTKGVQCATSIQCKGIWFANGKFGVTWKVLQARCGKPKVSEKGTCHVPLSSADKERLNSNSSPKQQEETEEMTEIVADSDEEVEVEEEEEEEVEEEEEPEPEPLPEPPKKKRVVRKKATAAA